MEIRFTKAQMEAVRAIYIDHTFPPRYTGSASEYRGLLQDFRDNLGRDGAASATWGNMSYTVYPDGQVNEDLAGDTFCF